jgi:hypothetical protein
MKALLRLRVIPTRRKGEEIPKKPSSRSNGFNCD